MTSPAQRKEQSEARLASLGASVNPLLPMIEAESEARLRTPADTARRTIVLARVAAVVHGGERESIVPFLKDNDIWRSASPLERRFLNGDDASEDARIQASRRTEAAWLLLWALDKLPELGVPDAHCETGLVYEAVPGPGSDPGEFVRMASLRSVSEILDVSDFLYRAHWSTREVKLGGGAECGDLKEEVLQEWHQSINWLTCQGDPGWDTVTTDT